MGNKNIFFLYKKNCVWCNNLSIFNRVKIPFFFGLTIGVLIGFERKKYIYSFPLVK
jgi:hypothetical protein